MINLSKAYLQATDCVLQNLHTCKKENNTQTISGYASINYIHCLEILDSMTFESGTYPKRPRPSGAFSTIYFVVGHGISEEDPDEPSNDCEFEEVGDQTTEGGVGANATMASTVTLPPSSGKVDSRVVQRRPNQDTNQGG